VSIQDQIRELVGNASAKHKRLIAYVVRQLRTGRDLDDVLEDPYITNRATPIERRALLDEPEVVEAARDDLLARMRDRLEALAGG
jgi:hypothetical protein